MPQFVPLILRSWMWVLLGQHHFPFAVFPAKLLFAETDCSHSRNLENIFVKRAVRFVYMY